MRIRVVVAAALVLVLGPGFGQQAKVNNLKSDLKSVRGKRESIKRQLDSTRAQVRSVRVDLREIDQQLGTLENKLNDTTARLSDSRSEQTRLARELEEASAQLEVQREQLRHRLRTIYMRGDASFISALAGVDSVGELASRKYLLERIASKDRSLFNGIVELRQGISKRKARADELVVRIDKLAREQQAQQAFVQQVRDEKNANLRDLRGKQSDLEKLIAQLDAEERSIAAQIAAYQSSSGSANLPKYAGRMIKPVNAPITSKFGMRFHPILKVNRLHAGIDFGTKSGTPIRAAAPGVVIAAQYNRSYGNMVVIDHGGGISTLYGHCSSIGVLAGQKVQQGQVIAAVGSTGLSTAPHLHFEVRVGGKPVNPLSYL
ncbi:MAG: peptidoglycan DD-metalloendopeptidase family protein [Fimbriimonadaceae bacterium]|nr:peptidoglycan DD-metalloendopeptidase family protein [Chthonomonadaceae bacterium]MCO5295634.1 peptidoglycan DD-metalloendopeptidase family protein [Fimbriimonadaceae bacterium]